MAPGKHKNWHRAWSRLPNGLLRHISGVEIEITDGDGCTDSVVAQDSLDEFQRYELARGVPLHDLTQRLQRLCREALEWNKANP